MNLKQNIKIVGFDFFDTLFHRDCHTEKILVLWAREMSSFMHMAVCSQYLYMIRKEAERELKLNGKREEASYHELIGLIYSKLNNSVLSQEDFYKKSLTTEIDLEEKHLYPDNNNLSLLKEYFSNGKKIVLISDFYCGAQLFDAVLNEFGLRKYFSDLYVSSDLNKRKSTGSLYKYVLKDQQIYASELLMIGDNVISDYTIPRKLQINTYRKPYKSNKLINNKKYIVKCFDKALKQIPFGGYTPVLFLFCERLYINATKKRINTLLFCAREGQNLKKIFDYYQEVFYPEHKIKTKYLYISRRASLMPSLLPLQEETFGRITRQYEELTVKDFLYSCGFDYAEIDLICEKIQLKSDALVSSADHFHIINQLKSNKDFESIYEEKRVRQKKLLSDYIMQLSGNSDEIALVDIGWKGTIQDNVFSALDRKKKVFGFYFGLFSETASDGMNWKIGLVFDEKRKTDNFKLFVHNYVQLERVFAANHGQTIEYIQTNNSVLPIISQDPKDVEIYNFIEKFQKDMNKTFEYICSAFENSTFDSSGLEKEIANNYLKYLTTVVPREYEMFLDFGKKVKENFGNISHKKVKEEKFIQQDKIGKKNFLYVDYVYRVLDKLHLKFFYPAGSLYCYIVYLAKKISIK